MLDDTTRPYTLETPSAPLHDPALMAAAGFLAGYSGTTRVGYTIDLRSWWRWCELAGLDVFDAKRAHIELYVRSLEDHPYARSTIGRRLLHRLLLLQVVPRRRTPESLLTIEPAETGQFRGRMQTGWFDLTTEEASLLESIFFGPQGAP
jgi:hypothetical protein